MTPTLSRRYQTDAGDIRNHKIASVVNTQKLIKWPQFISLAKRSGVPIVRVTESQPAHTSYKAWMMRQFDEVQRVQNHTR